MGRRNENTGETVKNKEVVKSIISNFFEAKDLIKVLVGKEGGKSLLEELVSILKGAVSFTKVRRYYEQFLSIYEEAFREFSEGKKKEPLPENILVKLYLLRSHVVYDKAREKKKEKFEILEEFITALILRAGTYEGLEKAKHLFEAFVGYAKSELDKDKK